ncbi:MAG: LUD domain-containing protein [Corynebacterium sp.]|uniref:LutC/YkgG family protein n=1 Tax=Corynebacterium sp. TaxID=1720 RepID=UPI0026E00DBD|nr:LUD domain-containing protein [Corynebacterium sp.]MDO5670227.1 LUD domain-containing protein [Corynebacterium sp.]
MSARADIMNRLRASLSDAPAAPEVPRAYRRSSARSPEEVREMLVDRLVDYRAAVHTAVEADLPALLDSLITGAVVVPDGLDPTWLPLAEEVTDPLDAACVVTSSTVSCAETGTIILTGQPAEGRRALSLIPDHHICIVPAETIVELFPEAWERVIAAGLEGPITMISGPSATSDIELERVEGVHGPRQLDVVILG